MNVIPEPPVVSARGLVKSFGPVEAMRGADFDLNRGEILAVIGDNGAGKSTLIKTLTGLVQPDQGQILIDGKPRRLPSPTDVAAVGIGVVHQDLALAAEQDLVSNMFLGREIRRAGLAGRVLRSLDRNRMEGIARRELSALGLSGMSLSAPVRKLSGGQRQAVAIARGMAFGARVLILDEPTAALGVRETSIVTDAIRRLRDQGVSIAIISHNLPQVMELADRVHIHRHGRRAAVVTTSRASIRELVDIMTGADER